MGSVLRHAALRGRAPDVRSHGDEDVVWVGDRRLMRGGSQRPPYRIRRVQKDPPYASDMTSRTAPQTRSCSPLVSDGNIGKEKISRAALSVTGSDPSR